MDMRDFLGGAPVAPDHDIVLQYASRPLELGRDENAVEVPEPTTEELRRQELGGIDPWFFEGTNIEQALQKVVEKDLERARKLFELLEEQTHIGGLVLQGDGSDTFVTDTLHPAEIKLLQDAKASFEHYFRDESETDESHSGVSKGIAVLGGGALGTAVGLITPLAVPELAAMSTYGPIVGGIAGGIAFGAPFVKGIWERWQTSMVMEARGDECVDLLEGIQQKILNDTGATRLVDDWLDDIDLKKIKKSHDPDFMPYLDVVEEHQESIRSHTKKVGEAIMAKIRGEYYDHKGKRRSKNELWFNPKEAAEQILQKLQDIDPSLPMELWRGIDGQTDMKSIMQRISGVTAELAELEKREEVVLSIDNDARHQQKDDVEATERFNDGREVLKKQQALAILEFIRLRQFVMRELSPTGSGLVSPAKWPQQITTVHNTAS